MKKPRRTEGDGRAKTSRKNALKSQNKPDKRAETSPQNARKGSSGRPPNPDYFPTAVTLTERNYTDPDTDQLALRHWRGQWFSYNGTGWKDMAEEEVLKSTITHLEEEEFFVPKATRHYVTNIITHLKGFKLCGISGKVNMPVWLNSNKSARNWMGFRNNKAVNVWAYARSAINKRTVKPLSPDLFTRDYVAYPFNPQAKCPRFMKYLERSVPDKESRELIQEMLGLCVADTAKYETFFYLYGPTARNGKTVLLRILEALVGKHNTSHVSLTNLIERFETWPLAEAKVNVYGDMATDVGWGNLAHVEGLFKDYVSGASVEYQKKGKDKFDAPCRARFIFAGNSLPTFVDRSDAIWERLRVIYFQVRIPLGERDPNLADKIIKEEMPGVFNWAVKGLARIIKRGRVMESKEGLTVKKRHRLECNHEEMFVQSMGFAGGSDDDYIKQTEVFATYKDWMRANGYVPCGSAKFYERFQAVIPSVREGQKRLDGKDYPERVYRGVKVRGKK